MVNTQQPNGETVHKRRILEGFLEQEYALVHFSPDKEGVVVPEHLKKDPSVTLKLSRMFRGRMEVFDWGVEADLLFKGEYFSCRVPFQAMWGISDMFGKTTLWPQCLPPQLERKALQAKAKPKLNRIK